VPWLVSRSTDLVPLCRTTLSLSRYSNAERLERLEPLEHLEQVAVSVSHVPDQVENSGLRDS
jgi:hypothetical protein